MDPRASNAHLRNSMTMYAHFSKKQWHYLDDHAASLAAWIGTIKRTDLPETVDKEGIIAWLMGPRAHVQALAQNDDDTFGSLLVFRPDE